MCCVVYVCEGFGGASFIETFCSAANKRYIVMHTSPKSHRANRTASMQSLIEILNFDRQVCNYIFVNISFHRRTNTLLCVCLCVFEDATEWQIQNKRQRERERKKTSRETVKVQASATRLFIDSRTRTYHSKIEMVSNGYCTMCK